MKAHQLPNGKIAMRYPPAVHAWRAQVQQAAAEGMELRFPFEQAVSVHLGFELPRPIGHYGTGRNAGQIRQSAPPEPTVMPDLDKLVRCVCDALTDAGVWKDDAQVVQLIAAKRYAKSQPGVRIQVQEVQ
jgi:crossover junction endodeoxyribonuclease RusA